MLVITKNGKRDGKTLFINKLAPSNAESIQSFGVNTIFNTNKEQIIVINIFLLKDLNNTYNSIRIKINSVKNNIFNLISPHQITLYYYIKSYILIITAVIF